MRYFFNLAGAVFDPDNEGNDLASVSDARIMAAKFAGDYVRDRPEVVWQNDEFRVEVTNEDRMVLFTLIVLGVDAPTMGKATVELAPSGCS